MQRRRKKKESSLDRDFFFSLTTPSSCHLVVNCLFGFLTCSICGGKGRESPSPQTGDLQLQPQPQNTKPQKQSTSSSFLPSFSNPDQPPLQCHNNSNSHSNNNNDYAIYVGLYDLLDIHLNKEKHPFYITCFSCQSKMLFDVYFNNKSKCIYCNT